MTGSSDRGSAASKIIILILVLFGVFVAADRLAVYAGEQAAENTLQRAEGLAHRPDVRILGFPVLPGMVGKHLDHVTVGVSDVTITAAGASVPIARLDIDMRHLSVSSDLHTVRVRTATATVVLPYSTIGRRLGVTLRYVTGRVQATKTITIAGRPVSASLATRVALSGEALSFLSVDSTPSGIPAEVLAQLKTALGVTVPLTDVPFRLHVSGVRAVQRGLAVSFAATDLSFQR